MAAIDRHPQAPISQPESRAAERKRSAYNIPDHPVNPIVDPMAALDALIRGGWSVGIWGVPGEMVATARMGVIQKCETKITGKTLAEVLPQLAYATGALLTSVSVRGRR